MHGTATITAGLSQWPFFREAWRAVATAKIDAFDYQCRRFAELSRCGTVDRGEAAAVLQDISVAHSLGETFGHEAINEIITDAFAAPEAECAA
jgi:hypothetical protein